MLCDGGQRRRATVGAALAQRPRSDAHALAMAGPSAMPRRRAMRPHAHPHVPGSTPQPAPPATPNCHAFLGISRYRIPIADPSALAWLGATLRHKRGLHGSGMGMSLLFFQRSPRAPEFFTHFCRQRGVEIPGGGGWCGSLGSTQAPEFQPKLWSRPVTQLVRCR